MKILRLRFKNINSFYGKSYTIDFTARPLSDSGLFIISGPTGAGKSTILDVITLALYNEVPRFEKGISKTEIDKLGSIVNARAAEEPKCEAFAEVEYEVRSGRYRAAWSISKNRNGNWNNYQMEISKLPEETLLEVKSLGDYPKKNAELIGLNFDQFVKSIILAQGSFAEFLKADRNTRTKLLEDITGTHIYRKLGEQSYERFKESAGQIRLKEAELKGVVLKTEAEVAELTDRKIAQEGLREKSEREVEKWEKERNLSNEQDKLRAAARKIEADQLRLTAELEAFSESREQLAAHESVSHLAAPLTKYRESQRQLKRIEDEIASRGKQAARLVTEEAGLLESISALVGQEVAGVDFIPAVDRFENEILGLELEIKEQRARAAPIDKAVRSEIAAANHTWAKGLSVSDYESSLEALSNRMAGLAATLSAYPANFDASERLKVLDADFETLSDLKARFQDRERLGEEGRKLRDELARLSRMESQLQPELAASSARLAAIKKNIEQKTDQWIRESTSQKLEVYRDNLREGEPCPLCGSSDHPYLTHYVNLATGLAKEIQDLKSELAAVEIKEKRLVLEVDGGKKKAVELGERLNAMRSDYKQVDGVIRETVSKMGLGPEATADDLQQKLRAVQQEKAGIDSWVKGQEQVGLAARLKEGFTELMAVRNEVRRLDEEKKRRYSGNQIQQEARELRSKWENLITVREENNRQLVFRENELNETRREMEEVLSGLQAELQRTGLSSPEDAEKRIIPAVQYQKLKLEADRLLHQSQNLKLMAAENARMLTERTAARNFPELSTEEIERLSGDARQHFRNLLQEIASLQTLLQTELENRERFGLISNELAELQKEHRKWDLLRQYIGDASGNNFSGFAQSLTLQNLIGLANLRLQKLSDRYILDKPGNDSEGLYVLDTYHGNQARAVSTLSGGETFTVSLALALALSDLASRNVRIESLFIDEGFGTLDAETLESAVAILERLQDESSKTVGVISHRPEMKERIPVQIQVEKGIDGSSSVHIVG